MQALLQPTLLASFPVASSSKDTLDRLPLAIAPVAGAEQAEAVTAVQGNALWIHDLSTHRAITSYTVPPSTTFHTKPVSFHARVDAESIAATATGEQAKQSRRKERRTAIALKKGEGVGAELEGRVVWVWTGEEVFDKQTITLSHKARSLHHVPSSATILATSPDSLTLLSPSLDATHLPFQPVQGGKATAALYSNLVKTILPARSSPTEPINVVLIYSSGHVRLVTIAHEGEQAFTIASERVIPFPKGVLVTHEIVVDAHLDEVKGTLHYYTNNNRMLASVLNIKTPTAPPHLSTVYAFTSPAAQVSSNGRLTTVPTGSGSLLLLASPPSLALFHPSYPAVIDARDLPRSAASNVQQVTMLSPRIAGVVSRISASADSSASAASGGEKDVVYLVEVTIPPTGVGIAQLLSSAERTARFITSIPSSVDDTPAATSTAGSETSVAARDAAFLDSFSQALLKSDAQAAQDLFNAYEIAEGDPFAQRTKKLLKIREQESAAVKARSTAGLVGEILRRVFEATLTMTSATEGAAGEGEVLVRKPDGVYPAAIIRSLIRREWVSEGMWARGGVVRALLALGDWESIMLALPRLPAVPSASLVATLHAILHNGTSSAISNAPILSKFLESYTRAPCSAALHRRALHTGLSTADACAVLEVYCGWLEVVKEQQEGKGWCDGLTSTWGVGEAEKKAVSPVMAMKDVPLSSVIQHTQLILDAHLPSLIAYLPAHALLERLDAALQPLLSAQNALVAARGTVDAFIKLSRREEKQRTGNTGGKKGGKASGAVGRADGVAFDGVYSVEEIQL